MQCNQYNLIAEDTFSDSSDRLKIKKKTLRCLWASQAVSFLLKQQ